MPQDPTSLLLGTYTDKMVIQKDTCTPVFTAMLFITATARKQPKCSSADEWIKRMWYLYTTEYYLATKRNETPTAATRWS